MNDSTKPAGTAYMRWIMCILGFAIFAWGYSNYDYPTNVVLMVIGGIIVAGTIMYILLSGKRKKHNKPGNVQGQDQNAPSFKTGSTVQGGSNYGQGSSYLSGKAYEQGSIKNKGSNYENEQDFNAE